MKRIEYFVGEDGPMNERLRDESRNAAAVKQGERLRLASVRNELENRGEHSFTACRVAAEWLLANGIKDFMAYVPFRSELDTLELLRFGWHHGLDVTLPRVDTKTRSMTLYRISSLDELVPGAYGILEPDTECLTALHETYVPSIIFIPGLGFDLNGGRLGYGGGYYDRYLERLVAVCSAQGRELPLLLGIGFGVQIVPSIIMEEHDIPLDGVVTEQGLLFKKKVQE